MIKNVLVIFISIFCAFQAMAQVTYISHRIQKGETIFSITQKYQITESELLKLNPEISNGLKENAVIIVTQTLETVEEDNDGKVTFKEHKVKRKETIFGIATQYGITVEDLKKYNKHLYSKDLKKGETIQIPIRRVTIAQTSSNNSEKENQHIVKSKETKFGIAQQYGITVAELESLNPVIYGTDNLPLGLILKVPKKKSPIENIEETNNVEEEGYTYYTIKPKEGFYRMKVLFGLSEEEIIALNPGAKDGLKEGMIIKIPGNEATNTEEQTFGQTSIQLNLENKLIDFKTKTVVLFLPFQLDRIKNDSISSREDEIVNNSSMRIALDFYRGALTALNFAQERGISVSLHVFDARETSGGVLSLFNKQKIKDVDLVIGPLHQADVEKVTSELQKKDIPVISPLSNRQGKMYSNFIQSIPPNSILEDTMISYLKDNHQGKNIILVADGTRNSQKQKLQVAIPGIQIVPISEGSYVKHQDLASKISTIQPNWVILETSKAILVSSVVGTLNGLNNNDNIQLFTLDKNDAFDFREVSNLHLANLQFSFPSVSKTNFESNNKFFNAYKDEYRIAPNRFAVRGFDVTYDALLRLSSSKDIFKANEDFEGEALYIENKFNYVKSNQGGYLNTACYLLKYTKELDLEEIK